MTPKEKAQDLIFKMSFETHKYNAKHCTLTAVDEILEELDNPNIWGIETHIFHGRIAYWEEVKEEIKKLQNV